LLSILGRRLFLIVTVIIPCLPIGVATIRIGASRMGKCGYGE
jgi:hypothetical protein